MQSRTLAVVALIVFSCTAVCVCADEVPISSADKEIPRLYRDLQRALNARGYDAGPVDGQFGPRTKAAIEEFKADNGISGPGLDKVTEKLGIPMFKACFWHGRKLACPLGCAASLVLTEAGVRGYAVDCPGYDTTIIPFPP